VKNSSAKGKGINSKGWVGNQVFRIVREKKELRKE
jgi:hypothetical protein